jgi:hypothetical protein
LDDPVGFALILVSASGLRVPLFQGRVGRDPDSCGCADDCLVSERLGQGDDCGRTKSDVRTGGARRRTVAPSDDNQVIEFEDVSSKIGVTDSVAQEERERVALDPG